MIRVFVILGLLFGGLTFSPPAAAVFPFATAKAGKDRARDDAERERERIEREARREAKRRRAPSVEVSRSPRPTSDPRPALRCAPWWRRGRGVRSPSPPRGHPGPSLASPRRLASRWRLGAAIMGILSWRRSMNARLPVAALLALCVGCSDYNLKPTGDVDPGPEDDPIPDIVVDPGEIALSGVCTTGAGSVIVTNAGDGDLVVEDVSVSGDGWVASTPDLPFTLTSGESVTIGVEGGVGEATLLIASTDPDEPTVTVPLSATGDSAPGVEITAPAHGDVLEAGDVALEALVTDAEDALDLLTVAWSSSVDGVVATDPPDAAGVAAATWADGRSEGPHVLTATVTDSCGNSASAEINVCQQGGYEVDELDLDDWHFEGVASWDATNGWLELTPASVDVVGTAFEVGHKVDGGAVDIEFLFYIGGGSGADGLSLTALDADRATTYLGGTGCGLGYGGDAGCTAGPALPGWSIEIDTYYNSGYDPTEDDHVMFTFDGDVDDPAVWAALPEMEDTGWHTMVVNVAAPHVTVTIDGTTHIDQDLSGDFSFPAWVGFTAGTGSLTNAHLIDSLTVTEYVCE